MPQVDTSAFNEHAEFVLRDENGQPFLVIGHEKVTLVDVNGEISECARENAILLVDGVMWTPQMLKWANPVLLTVCSVCRCATISLFQPKRSSHGLLSVRNARNCVGCGCVLCAQHRGVDQ